MDSFKLLYEIWVVLENKAENNNEEVYLIYLRIIDHVFGRMFN